MALRHVKAKEILMLLDEQSPTLNILKCKIQQKLF